MAEKEHYEVPLPLAATGRIFLGAVVIFTLGALLYHWLCMTLRPHWTTMASTLSDLVAAPLGAALLTAYFTRLLGRQNRQLLALDAQKQLLAYSIVHDLRQPLAAIEVCLDILQKQGGLSEETWRSMVFAQASVSRLSEMVADLLDVVRLEADQPLAHRLEIIPGEFIREGVQLVQPVIAARKQKLTVSVPQDLPSVLGDQGLLRRVVTNLVGNAAKSTPMDGAIEISASQDWQQRRLRVRVSDSGPGVPKELRPRLFEMFARVESEGRGPAGTGLGLYFCRKVIEAHGGAIWLEEKEHGANFVFEIPSPAGATVELPKPS